MDDNYVSIPISSLQDAPSEVGIHLHLHRVSEISELSQDTRGRGRARIGDSDVEASGGCEMIGRLVVAC
ncbi:hypothetical protein RHGRI_015973 [Rhododendron griersonianum]|uniref:Uncharacterized protein n=1 Tax=Rhododendron griersonianum TaxID=479676 RepID=A0AAV6JSC9_9ERIC|nr:hypothetical protein RHGRI_015973 [Rhododendron griersonianum]